jgi:hypothetical protein
MCDENVESVMDAKKQLERLFKETGNEQIKNAIHQLDVFLSLHCRHNIVKDYIDIHPEASVSIQYCSICLTTISS